MFLYHGGFMKPSRLRLHRFPLYLLSFFIAFTPILIPNRANASWSFTATLYQNDCGGYASILTLPSITGFPNQALCNQIRAAVLADQQGASWVSGCNPICVEHYCSMGFHCTPCSGSDDTTGGNGTMESLNPQGDTQGQPYFSPHYTADTENWLTQTFDRFNGFSWFNTGVPAFPHGMALSDDADMNDAYAYLANNEYGTKGEASDALAKLNSNATQDTSNGTSGDLTESDFFFQLQTRQVGDHPSDGTSPVVDTTQLATPSQASLDSAASDAAQNTEVGGDGLQNTLSDMAGNAKNAVDQWTTSANGEVVSTLDDVAAIPDGLAVASGSEAAGLGLDVYGVAKDFKEGNTGQGLFDTGTIMAAMAYPPVAVAKAYGDFCQRLEKFDETLISNAAKSLANPNDTGNQ
jgi:hypothetical protein